MTLMSYLLGPYVLTTLVVGLVSWYVARFYLKVRKYPPGPTPLPLLGNIHQVIGAKSIQDRLEQFAKQYGDPFTIWAASTPTVCIMGRKNVDLCHVGPQKSHFAGRVETNFGKLHRGDNDDVFFNDMDEPWDAVRKVMIRAIRKYARSDLLPELCAKVTREQMEEAADKGEEGKNIVDIVDHTMEIVATYTAFGMRPSKDDPEVLEMRENFKMLKENAQQGLPSDIHPALKYLLFWKEHKVTSVAQNFIDYSHKLYERAKTTYKADRISNFTDALQAAKIEAEEDERSIAQYLTEGNLRQAIHVLFIAGYGGNRIALTWACLYLAKHAELQEEIHKEVVEVLGEESLVALSNRHSFPKLESFIAETIRLNPPAPLAVLHKSMCDSEIGGYKIPAETSLMFDLQTTLRDPELYPDPEKFIPDRFINKETGKFQVRRAPEYTAFGVGPRACPGEALAYADMVYVLATILQKYQLCGTEGPESVIIERNPKMAFGNEPTPQNIVVKRRMPQRKSTTETTTNLVTPH